MGNPEQRGEGGEQKTENSPVRVAEAQLAVEI